VYRSYCGDFKKLCDVVRCCLVLDTPDDMINLVKVFKTRTSIHLRMSHTFQKMLDPDHATVAQESASPVRDLMASLWTTLLVRGLGLIPIRDSVHADDEQASGAFEILRVSSAQMPASLKFCAFSGLLPARFAIGLLA
jgi:hypothetical protein